MLSHKRHRGYAPGMFAEPPTAAGSTPITLGLLLPPDFAMLAFVSAIEPLRAANRIAQRELYRWHLYSPDDAPVRASNGILVVPDRRLDETQGLDTVFVCGALDVHRFDDASTHAWLREQAQRAHAMGALSTGTFILAWAGLLNGYRCTTHWESLPALAEAHPGLDATGSLFEIDRDRFTSSGGTASLDLILHLIAGAHGDGLASAVANQFIHGRIRASADRQPMAEQIQLRTQAPKLAAAVDIMRAQVEEPLSTDGIARRIGVSRRQLERLFRQYRDCTPRHHYIEIRLEHARVLLLETGLSILNVALASGFTSQSHFGACYRAHFGHTPGDERQRTAAPFPEGGENE